MFIVKFVVIVFFMLQPAWRIKMNILAHQTSSHAPNPNPTVTGGAELFSGRGQCAGGGGGGANVWSHARQWLRAAAVLGLFVRAAARTHARPAGRSRCRRRPRLVTAQLVVFTSLLALLFRSV